MLSFRVIDEGQWREPIDPTIPITYGGQFYKHFHHHVRPLDSTPETSFRQYAELPAELQLHVVQLCDTPTLFQLMHTSRHLRTEAKKLFFSDPSTWYRQNMDILLKYGTPGESIYDVDFLSCVEQLDLECDQSAHKWLPHDAWDAGGSDEEVIELNTEHTAARMREFWQTLLRLCPRVKRVRLSHDTRSSHDEHPVNEWDKKLADACPPGIEVSIYVPETDKELKVPRKKRVWWRLRTGNDATPPTPSQLSTAPGTIVTPPQKPHRGRVGAFIESQNLWRRFNTERFPELHRMMAMEKHHFDGRHEPFGCAAPDCRVWFEQPEEYTMHALLTLHDNHDAPPEPYKALFAENDERIKQLREVQQDAHREFWNWYGEWDSEQHVKAEKELMEQLESDELYKQDKPVQEHGLLLQIHEIYNQSY